MYRSTYYKYITIVEDIGDYESCAQDDMEEVLELKEDAARIMDIVNTLNSNHQQIFRLKVFGDMTFKDIGTLLEISESTVKTRYYSTVKKIKSLLVVKDNG